MREILFRGKRTDNAEWVEGHYNYANWYLPPSMKIVDTTHHILPIGHGDSHKVVPETVGQYTGLTDKNGKKIFEGDILNIGGDVYSCCWDKCNFEFGVSNKKESFGLAYVASPCVEIIGNIHDNPELLGGSDND